MNAKIKKVKKDNDIVGRNIANGQLIKISDDHQGCYGVVYPCDKMNQNDASCKIGRATKLYKRMDSYHTYFIEGFWIVFMIMCDHYIRMENILIKQLSSIDNGAKLKKNNQHKHDYLLGRPNSNEWYEMNPKLMFKHAKIAFEQYKTEYPNEKSCKMLEFDEEY